MTAQSNDEKRELIIMKLKSGQLFYFEGHQGTVDSVIYLESKMIFEWESFSYHSPAPNKRAFSEREFRTWVPTSGLFKILYDWAKTESQ